MPLPTACRGHEALEMEEQMRGYGQDSLFEIPIGFQSSIVDSFFVQSFKLVDLLLSTNE